MELPTVIKITNTTIDDSFEGKNDGGRYALNDNSTVGRVNFGAKTLTVILNEVKKPLEESVDDEE